MTASSSLEVSLHQIRDGKVQTLDDRRYLHPHAFALVQDEEMVSVETPDGGRAWAHGAGPSGGWQSPSAISISVDALSEDLARVIHSHAVRGDMVIALWPRSADDNYVYVWEKTAASTGAAEDAPSREFDVRSIPTAVFLTNAAQTQLPASWPNPTICATAEQLFDSLSSAAVDD
jgi:hypothetical protein